jgi:hypothetical protein
MSLIIPYDEIPTSKKVPASAKILELLGKSDLVKERYSVSVQPYSGQGAGIGAGLNQKITFKIFNNSDYCDLQTAYLTFQTNFSGTLAHLNFEDNVLSWFILARTLVNDQVVEEISNFNIWVNLITYASMSKSYYETSASFSGAYRHSNYLTGGPKGVVLYSATGTATPLDFGQQIQGQQMWEQLQNGIPSWTPNTTVGSAPVNGSGGNDSWVNLRMRTPTFWNAPLAGYLGIFSLEKYFPLRSVSSVTLELNLPTNIAGVVFDNLLPASTTATTVAGVTLSLQNLYLHYDCVKMSDAYYELMDSELVDPNGLGVQYTVNTVESIPASITSGAGKRVLIASKGTRFLKSFYACQMPVFAYQSGFCPPSSGFIQAGFQSAQLVVNSKRFPQYMIDNLPRAYSELMKSVGKFHSVVGDSIITYPKYVLDVAGGATDYNSTPDNEYASFILGFNLEQVLDSPEITLQGENTLTAGFQIQLELTANAPVPMTAYMFPHFAKVLRIKGGSVSILN